jgi:hypothetical protein
MRAHFELLKDVICGGAFGMNDTSADVGVLHLTEQSGFWALKVSSAMLDNDIPWPACTHRSGH